MNKVLLFYLLFISFSSIVLAVLFLYDAVDTYERARETRAETARMQQYVLLLHQQGENKLARAREVARTLEMIHSLPTTN